MKSVLLYVKGSAGKYVEGHLIVAEVNVFPRNHLNLKIVL